MQLLGPKDPQPAVRGSTVHDASVSNWLMRVLYLDSFLSVASRGAHASRSVPRSISVTHAHYPREVALSALAILGL